MRRKPSRPSRKKSRPVWKPAKGPDLAQVLHRHPEVQAMLRALKLRIKPMPGIVVGRTLWPCPQPPPPGPPLERSRPGRRRTRS